MTQSWPHGDHWEWWVAMVHGQARTFSLQRLQRDWINRHKAHPEIKEDRHLPTLAAGASVVDGVGSAVLYMPPAPTVTLPCVALGAALVTVVLLQPGLALFPFSPELDAGPDAHDQDQLGCDAIQIRHSITTQPATAQIQPSITNVPVKSGSWFIRSLQRNALSQQARVFAHAAQLGRQQFVLPGRQPLEHICVEEGRQFFDLVVELRFLGNHPLQVRRQTIHVADRQISSVELSFGRPADVTSVRRMIRLTAIGVFDQVAFIGTILVCRQFPAAVFV